MSPLKLVSSVFLAVLSNVAFAQVATLTGLTGTVLVSQGDAMVAGSNGQPLAIGTRIVTTAGSQVTVNYSRECNVTLRENQRFVVREFTNCQAMIAAIEGTGLGTAAAGAAVAGGTLFAGGSATAATLATLGVGVAALGYALSQSNKAASISPF